MLNEERISIMSKLEIFEKNEGRQNSSIRSFFRGDYIGLNMIKSVICASISFVLIGALVIIYKLNDIMAGLYTMDFATLAKDIIIYYILTVAIYCVFSYIIYALRYAKAKKKQKGYLAKLRRLSEIYQAETKSKSTGK